MIPIVACLPLKVNWKQPVQQNQRIEGSGFTLWILWLKHDVKKPYCVKRRGSAKIKEKKNKEKHEKNTSMQSPIGVYLLSELHALL